jgi:hypothetical protein
MIQTENLVIGKRYYFDESKTSNGVYNGKSEGDNGLIFTDVKDNTVYSLESNNSVGFMNMDLGLNWYEYEGSKYGTQLYLEF